MILNIASNKLNGSLFGISYLFYFMLLLKVTRFQPENANQQYLIASLILSYQLYYTSFK